MLSESINNYLYAAFSGRFGHTVKCFRHSRAVNAFPQPHLIFTPGGRPPACFGFSFMLKIVTRNASLCNKMLAALSKLRYTTIRSGEFLGLGPN